jgi:heptosyltransferase-2
MLPKKPLDSILTPTDPQRFNEKMNPVKKYAYTVFKAEASQFVYSNASYFIAQKGLASLFFKRLKRDVSLFIFGQFKLLRRKMPKKGARILWINLGMPQIGDALCDLSCRVLLDPKDYHVDLLTESVVCDLFRGDPYFKEVSDNIYSFTPSHYDFVIMPGYSWKSVKVKVFHLRSIPFFSIYKHYSGLEFNRIMFAYHALFLSLQTKNAKANKLIKTCPTFFNLKYDHAEIKRKKNQIVVVVGGVVPERIYNQWVELIKKLLKDFNYINIVLLGSLNGSEMARQIMQSRPNSKRIQNLVAKTSLGEAFNILKESAIMICADGGLLHMGRAARIPTLGLFSGDIHPLMRFNKDDPALAFHARPSVSVIAPSIIIDGFRKLRDASHPRLQIIFQDGPPPF